MTEGGSDRWRTRTEGGMMNNCRWQTESRRWMADHGFRRTGNPKVGERLRMNSPGSRNMGGSILG